jgi:hypothetical protein
VNKRQHYNIVSVRIYHVDLEATIGFHNKTFKTEFCIYWNLKLEKCVRMNIISNQNIFAYPKTVFTNWFLAILGQISYMRSQHIDFVFVLITKNDLRRQSYLNWYMCMTLPFSFEIVKSVNYYSRIQRNWGIMLCTHRLVSASKVKVILSLYINDFRPTKLTSNGPLTLKRHRSIGLWRFMAPSDCLVEDGLKDQDMLTWYAKIVSN